MKRIKKIRKDRDLDGLSPTDQRVEFIKNSKKPIPMTNPEFLKLFNFKRKK